MDANTVAHQMSQVKGGTLFTIVIQRPGKTRKGCPFTIEKVSQMQCIKAEYANRAPVKDAVADGLRDAPEIKAHLESYDLNGIRFHRNKASGALYLPVCLSGNQPKAQWLCDGNEVAKEEIAEWLLASESAKKLTKEETEERGQAQFCDITVENILEIRSKSIVS